MERYLRGERIGTGGTATVYRATDVRLNRSVAIKVLHAHLSRNSDAARRLDGEVEITSSLSHPGIVAIYDFGSYEEETWVAMELMTGGDLRRRILLAGRLPAPEVEGVARSVLSALASAHSAGVIHRDIKPRNILFDGSGRAKVADFGLARSALGDVLADEGQYTSVAGTAEYCAPEAVTAGLWDARTDLYALGCTLYEALVGRPPFVANTPDQVLRKHVEEERPLLPDDLRDSAPGLTGLVETLLRKDPNDRFQSADEALDYLHRGVSAVAVASADGDTVSCGWCGAPVSRVYPWCFSCGRATIPAQQMRRRGYTVVVAGPGKAGEQLKPGLRDVCCRAVDAMGLDATRLRKRLPRVPFVLVRSLNRAGAHRIAEVLVSGGVEVAIIGPEEASRGALMRSITKKTMTMAPRVYFVMMGMGGGFFSLINNTPGMVAVTVLGTMVAAVPVGLGFVYSRAQVGWGEDGSAELPTEVAEVLRTVTDPLLHARMRSVAEDGARLVAAARAADGAGGALQDLEGGVRRATSGVAGLVQSLAVVKQGARAAGLAALESTDETERAEASSLLRSAEGVYTKTMERIGRTSLSLRRLALRLTAVEAGTAAVDLAVLGREVQSLGDEVEATREIERFLERMA